MLNRYHVLDQYRCCDVLNNRKQHPGCCFQQDIWSWLLYNIGHLCYTQSCQQGYRGTRVKHHIQMRVPNATCYYSCLYLSGGYYLYYSISGAITYVLGCWLPPRDIPFSFPDCQQLAVVWPGLPQA